MSIKSDLKKFEQKVQQVIDAATSQRTRNGIAMEIADRIRERTRQGYGVKKAGASQSKLKPLKPSTIESRKRKKKKGLLSDKTSPGKSNLTESAQMLDALKGRAINKLVSLEFAGKRRGSPLTNAEVAVYAEANGREFFNVSSEDIRWLTKVLNDILNDEINKNFKK